MSSYQKLIEKNSNKLNQAFNEQYHIWMEHVLFTWRWWIGVGIIVLCIIAWIWLVHKESLDRFLFVGFFVALITSFLDQLGNFFGLWGLRYEVFPAVTYITWDLFFIPTLVVLLIQFKPRINPFIKACILGALTSFVGLPLMAWLNIYKLSNWEYIYSFPIQVIIYLLAHYFSTRKRFEPIEQ